MSRLIVVLCKLVIIAAVVDLVRRHWQVLALERWQVEMIAWPVLFFTLAVLLAFGYSLVLLARARAAIARRQAGQEDEQV